MSFPFRAGSQRGLTRCGSAVALAALSLAGASTECSSDISPFTPTSFHEAPIAAAPHHAL